LDADHPEYGVLFHAETHSRGHEIQAWLRECTEKPRYAIIDDDSDILPIQRPNFFQTNGADGLTHEIADIVAAHFNNREKL
jgi:hypothetical protein